MKTLQTDIVVIGAGPGGYAAAFYAADQGANVMLIEKDDLGGVCLNRGCIPSKAYLHATKMLSESALSEQRGISFGKPKIDVGQLRDWKNGIVSKLTGGIAQLAKKKGVTVLKGRALFNSDTQLRVETDEGQQLVDFNSAILAVGSRPALPAAFDLGNPRIMTSTEALEVPDIPKRLLVVGGGYIGLELGTVYAKLGSKVDVVEALPTVLAGADADLVRPVMAKAKGYFNSIMLEAKVKGMKTKGKTIDVSYSWKDKEHNALYDRVLISVGRVANSDDLGLQHTGVSLDEKGFVKVDSCQKSDAPSIYAIGDIAGGVLLAHKASKEAKTAVEAILGHSIVDQKSHIPAVVFTDPEVAWCGLTETEAREQGIAVEVTKFPWGASGRALTMDRTDGLTKIISEPVTERVLGVGLVGVGAGDLIAEGVLAIEVGLTVQDLAETVHPHPTLSESIYEAAEAFYGHSAHMISPAR